jgi:hypothetical protein
MFPSEPKESTEVIIRPAATKLGPTAVGGIVGPIQLGKPLWRKREVMKQEKTVYYTTLDEAGEVQVRTNMTVCAMVSHSMVVWIGIGGWIGVGRERNNPDRSTAYGMPRDR